MAHFINYKYVKVIINCNLKFIIIIIIDSFLIDFNHSLKI